MAGQELAVPSIDKAGVVDIFSRQFRNGAAHDIEIQLCRQAGEGLLDLTARFFTVGSEAAVFIGTAEHLRQYGDVCSCLFGCLDLFTGGAEIGGFVRCDQHLDQCNAHQKIPPDPRNSRRPDSSRAKQDGNRGVYRPSL